MENNLFNFKGIPYIKYINILENKEMVKIEEKDFKKMRDYIMELEWKLYKATGEKAKSFYGGQ